MLFRSTLNPASCCTQAGTYTITPNNLVLAVPNNYAITYVPGPLYVNPKGQGAKKIDIALSCVDTVSNDPSGFPYLARFTWTNANNTTVYVPLGADNFFTALGTYSGNPPVLYPPGTGVFQIPFDGNKLTWTLKSYNGNQKTSSASEASSTSNKCTAHLTRFTNEPNEEISDMKIYPNPSGGKFTLEYQGTMHDNATIFIVDMLGKVLNSKEVVGFDGFFTQEFDLKDRKSTRLNSSH